MSKATAQGYSKCPYHGCTESVALFKYARTSKNEHYADCPVHGRIDGRYKASPVNNDFLLQHQSSEPLAIEPAQALPEPDEQEPEGYADEYPQEVDPAPDEEPDSKSGSIKKIGGFGLLLGGIYLLFKG